ncbi:MAG: PAS domain-containing sensor histidine kinase, partial [Allorhizobium sp.]
MLDARRVTAADERLRIKFSDMVEFFRRHGGASSDSSAQAHGAAQATARSRRIETILRRAIPVLILAFLTVVALARTIGIMSEHQRMENAVRQSTALIAATVNAALGERLPLFETRNRVEAEKRLSTFLDREHFSHGAFVLLIDPAGRVFASSPEAVGQVGATLQSLLPEVMTIRQSGSRTGAIETDLNGIPHHAIFTPVGTDGAMIVAAHSLQAVEDFWRRELSLNVTLFTCISVILFVILYAYFYQVKRAREADDTFLESNLRVETALARGRCGLWDFDLESRKLVWSRSMYEMLGLTPSAQPLGKKVEPRRDAE